MSDREAQASTALVALACRACGSPNVAVEQRDDPDKPIKVICRDCRRVTWPPKPGNETRRRDHNQQHRKAWRAQLGGEYLCLWCGVHAQETRCGFVVDHLWPLEAGGSDQLANTALLCANCHRKRHADRDAVQHFRGRSARDHAEAAL